MIVLGLFSGISFPASGNAALHEVTGQDASLASGVQNATQAIGGAIGLSCLVTLALRHAASQIREGVPPSIASTHGYVLAFHIGSVLLVAGGVLVLVLLEQVIATPRQAEAEITAAPVLPADATTA
jgi:NADPH-dependent 2,4-dienoyl-CoA reductase/sulfur reductase-like enzyme